jgi:hypothetical protein
MEKSVAMGPGLCRDDKEGLFEKKIGNPPNKNGSAMDTLPSRLEPNSATASRVSAR